MIKAFMNLRRKDTFYELKLHDMYKLSLMSKIIRLLKSLKDIFNVRRNHTLIYLFHYFDQFKKNKLLFNLLEKVIIDRRKRTFDELIIILKELKEENDLKTSQKEKNICILVSILKKIIFDRRINTFNDINYIKYDKDFLYRTKEKLRLELDDKFKDMPLFDGIIILINRYYL